MCNAKTYERREEATMKYLLILLALTACGSNETRQIVNPIVHQGGCQWNYRGTMNGLKYWDGVCNYPNNLSCRVYVKGYQVYQQCR